ncbi:MAG TPA: vitamin K epoxide reductase family protein [Gemmatimonadaceae bacterium]|nr:vitamin K epoxide reductase family protein [Gemmatimonadaceae bacterium]
MSAATRRMAIATLALVGFFIAVYLTLFKLGVIGAIACRVGSCDAVNLSAWGSFLGVPVAAWGMLFYAVLFALAFAGVHERWADHRALPLALLLWTGWGVLFSLWLTYLELFVIHAICMWCVISATIVTIAFGVSLVDWRGVRQRQSLR